MGVLVSMCVTVNFILQATVVAKMYIHTNNRANIWYMIKIFDHHLDNVCCNDNTRFNLRAPARQLFSYKTWQDMVLIKQSVVPKYWTVFTALESQSCLCVNGDVAVDSSDLALRQRGDSWRSSIWVLHSSCPYTLLSRRSWDTTVQRATGVDGLVSCLPAGVGVWETRLLSSELWPRRRMVAQN